MTNPDHRFYTLTTSIRFRTRIVILYCLLNLPLYADKTKSTLSYLTLNSAYLISPYTFHIRMFSALKKSESTRATAPLAARYLPK